MFRVIKGELEIGARWRLRMTSLEDQNNAIFPFLRYYRTGVYVKTIKRIFSSDLCMIFNMSP